MKEILAGSTNLKTYNDNHSSADETQNKQHKPITICGWCGSVEDYISDDKTECPHCEDFLR